MCLFWKMYNWTQQARYLWSIIKEACQRHFSACFSSPLGLRISVVLCSFWFIVLFEHFSPRVTVKGTAKITGRRTVCQSLPLASTLLAARKPMKNEASLRINCRFWVSSFILEMGFLFWDPLLSIWIGLYYKLIVAFYFHLNQSRCSLH